MWLVLSCQCLREVRLRYLQETGRNVSAMWDCRVEVSNARCSLLYLGNLLTRADAPIIVKMCLIFMRRSLFYGDTLFE